jgi:multiple sugar transport system permease protein/sn-glycerol 3-phosphate transport system permease protein
MQRLSAPPIPMNRSMSRQWQREFMRQLPYHLVLLPGLVLVLIPLAWTLSTSLSELGDVFQWPIRWIPNPVRWDNYVEAMRIQPFGLYFFNTAFITLATIVGQLLSSSLVAFSFARLRWRGRDQLFVLVLATMMLPSQVTLIPQFIIFSHLGWINTFLPLIVPAFFGAPFFIFLLRQFYMNISLELDDAAKIDGASVFQIYSRLLLPMSSSALAAVAIFQFQHAWNLFLEPLLYLHSSEKWVLSLALRSFIGEYIQWWNLMMAASVIVMLPVIVLFFIGQRYFIQGVVFTGIK